MEQVINLYNKISFFYKIARYEKIYLKQNLEQYVDKGYFFHMADNPSLYGLNVKTTYKTPAGIYCYPLTKKMFDDLLYESLPFKPSSKYIWLLKPKKEPLKASEYTTENLINDVQKLIEKSSESKRDLLQELLQESKYGSSVMHPLSRLFYIIYGKNGSFSAPNIFKISSDFLYLGYTGIYDDLARGIIHPGEPTQAFFISSKFVDFIELFYNEEEKEIPAKPTKTVEKRISDNIVTSVLHFSSLTLEQKMSFVSWVSDNGTKEEKLFVINSIPKRYIDVFSEESDPGILNAYKLKIGDSNLELDNLEFKDIKLLLDNNKVNRKQKAYLINKYDCLGSDNKKHTLDEVVKRCFCDEINTANKKIKKIDKQIILSDSSKNYLQSKLEDAIFDFVLSNRHGSDISDKNKTELYDICKSIQMSNSRIIDMFMQFDEIPIAVKNKITNNLNVYELTKILNRWGGLESIIDTDSINIDIFFQALYKLPIETQNRICYSYNSINILSGMIRRIKSDNTAEIAIEILKNVGSPNNSPGGNIFTKIKNTKNVFKYNPKILEYLDYIEQTDAEIGF